MKIFCLALMSTLLLAFCLTGSALAHAKFVKSEPPPDSVLTVAPKQVTIWFTEELDTRLGVIKVFDAAGAQVDLGNSKVDLNDRKQLSVGLKPLSAGVYTVKWHAVSDDDKGETDGEFKFTVNVQATPSIAPTTAPTLATAVPSPTALPTAARVTPEPFPSIPIATPTPRAAAPTPVQQPTAQPTTVSPAAPLTTPQKPSTPVANTAASDLTLLLIGLSLIVLVAGAVLVLRRSSVK